MRHRVKITPSHVGGKAEVMGDDRTYRFIRIKADGDYKDAVVAAEYICHDYEFWDDTQTFVLRDAYRLTNHER